ncbi:phosphotransferase family protein [Phytohabitans sp. LJ34]|uniref:phosphotransferase family protein n=1 Tax=Phytohabitans sp. LJ34 TaxID=3452217 RepID=UPI003F8970D7
MDSTVRLVLVDRAGEPLGALPPFGRPEPWWQEVGGVVAEAHARFGVRVAVLRLLRAELPEPPGGALTMLAELDGPPPPDLLPVDGLDLSPHPLRAPYAEPGGPARSVAWATAALAGAGWSGVTATQVRTWNLSAIWRLDECAGERGFDEVDRPRRAWLKQVPAFFGHEAAVLRWLGEAVPGAAPPLAAAGDEGRILMHDVPGEDGWNASPAEREAIAAAHHRIQLASLGAVDALAAAGVPDRRGPLLGRWVRERLAAWRPAPGEVVPDVAALLSDMDARIAAMTACGLPDALVHGDLHPGNTRLGGGPPVVIDWGDSTVGNPAADILRLADRLDRADEAALVGPWAARWRGAVPGCDPERAVRLWRPVAELYLAAVYAAFLARIEPSERPYHAGDVAPCLRRAAAYAR